jgi:hypothetical protein
MTVTDRSAHELIPLLGLRQEYALSESTWRRALLHPTDPLPCVRVGLGDPKHARVLVRRADVEAWLARRNAAATPESVVDEIVQKAREDA